MNQGISLLSRIYLKLVCLQIAIGSLLRIILLFNEQTAELHFTFSEWLHIFVLGAVNDGCAITIGIAVLWLFCLSVFDGKYKKPYGYIIFGVLTAAWCYVTFLPTIFDEYGSAAPLVASIILAYWALIFGCRLFFPAIRNRWTTIWLTILLGLYVGGMIFNATSEWFFWSEFGVRYNFIAVDYLVYTSEVVGNIMESYPIFPIAAALISLTAAVTFFLFRHEMGQAKALKGGLWKIVCTPIWLLLSAGALWLLPTTARLQDSKNVYVNELQATGMYKFYDAFMKNELDYKQFYLTLPDDQAAATIHAIYGSTADNLRKETAPIPEQRRNIILITIESMSASFMEHFGGTDHITPCLDSLYQQGLAFEQLFATGNRTVRGLEAVTLSLPPCPGQSIIKRTKNADLYSTGAMLHDKGYSVRFFYGGNSYFDNMETFFGGNGYSIVDKKQYAPEEITFANIWGVCDEDAFNKVLRTLEKAPADTPFFVHMMTVSNHRPYTYPAGRISIPNDSKSRAGGVMYSDYALGQFIEAAKTQPWFANTVFVITADHCASSAGKTEIPLDKYHIPGLIYAPGFIAPEKVEKVASQIDLMPTLFALLGMEYNSHFFGRNVLAKEYTERAFIATYQDMGYLERDTLTILSPVCRSQQYAIQPTATERYNLVPVSTPAQTLIERAISFYQTSTAWNK
ncbi:MAG: LTA synthase family protein [Alistipes sp.]